MSDDQRFEEAYATQVAPHLPELEALRQSYRKQRLNTALVITAVGVAVVIATAAGFIGSGFSRIIIILVSMVGIAVGWFLVYAKYAERYRAALKERVMNVMCGLVGDMEWSGKSVGHHIVTASRDIGVVPKGNRTKVDDQFSGRYRDCEFHLIDLEVWRETNSGSDNTSSSKRVFNGLALSVSVPQQFDTRLVLDRDYGRVGNAISNWFAGFKGWRKVAFEDDPDFERAFEVRAEDEAGARELLSPGFRRIMMTLCQRFPDARLRAGFVNGEFLLSLEMKGRSFEPGNIHMPVADLEPVLRAMQAELRIGHDIIDILHGDAAVTS